MKNLMVAVAVSISFFAANFFAQVADRDARAIKVPSVEYPAEAAITGLEGQVSVLVELDDFGKVTKIREATGPGTVCPDISRADVAAMRQTAVHAAERATFSPAIRNGQPVASELSLTFKFTDPSPAKKVQPGRELQTARLAGFDPMVDLSKEPQPSTATKQTRIIGGAVIAGTKRSIPQPVYPPAARAVRASGAVTVQILIDTNGTVFTAESVDGHPLLRSAARLAACKARFPPALLSGEPVMIAGRISYNFELP
jgi:TonB family protein